MGGMVIIGFRHTNDRLWFHRRRKRVRLSCVDIDKAHNASTNQSARADVVSRKSKYAVLSDDNITRDHNVPIGTDDRQHLVQYSKRQEDS